jgi:hypothetical protein
MPNHDIIRGSVSVKIDVEELRDFTPAQLSALMGGVGQLVAATAHPIRGQTTTIDCPEKRDAN